MDSILKKDNKEQVKKDDKKNYDSPKKKQKNINKEEESREKYYDKLYKEYEQYKLKSITSRFRNIIVNNITTKACGIKKQDKESLLETFQCGITSISIITGGLKNADTEIRNDTQILENEVDYKLNEVNKLVNEINENELFETKLNNESNCNLFKQLIENSKLELNNKKGESLKLLNNDHRVLLKTFDDIKKSDYGKTVISYELIKAFVCEFIRQKNELLEEILDDNEIKDSGDRKFLKKHIVKLMEEIDEIDKSTLHSIKTKLDLLSAKIGEFNTLFYDFEKEIEELSKQTMESNEEIKLKSFNNIVDKIVTTFDNIIKSNCSREIELINPTGYLELLKKLKRSRLYLWRDIRDVTAIFKEKNLELKLKLVKSNKKQECYFRDQKTIKKNPGDQQKQKNYSKDQKKLENYYVKSEDMWNLTNAFNDLIKEYDKLTRKYLSGIFGLSGILIIGNGGSQKAPELSIKRSETDDYAVCLYRLSEMLRNLSDKYKEINSKHTTKEMFLFIQQSIKDINSCESSKDQIIKDIFYPDYTSYNIDEEKYQTSLRVFGEFFKEHNKMVLCDTFGGEWAWKIQEQCGISNPNSYEGFRFKDYWNKFKEINACIIKTFSSNNACIKQEMENNQSLKSVLHDFDIYTKAFHLVLDGLVTKISPEGPKINCIMMNYVIEEVQRLIEHASYVLFTQKILRSLVVCQDHTDKSLSLKKTYAQFTDTDLLIYLSYLIKIVIPDISEANKIDDLKSNKFVSYFLLVRSLKKSLEDIVSGHARGIKSAKESYDTCIKAYLELFINGNGSFSLWEEKTKLALLEMTNDMKAVIEYESGLKGKLTKKKVGSGRQITINKERDPGAVTTNDIKEILEYNNKVPSKGLVEIGEYLVKYSLEIPECFTELNAQEDLTKEDLKQAWLEYQKQQEDKSSEITNKTSTTFEYFNDVVNTIVTTFENIIKSNCNRDIKPINTIGFDQDYAQKIKDNRLFFWGDTLENIHKIFKNPSIENELKLLTEEKEKLRDHHIVANNMSRFVDQFKKLINEYVELTKKYLEGVFSSCSMQIIKSKKIKEPGLNNQDNYLGRLSYLIKKLKDLLDEKIYKSTTEKIFMSITKLIDDIKSFESLKDKMIKDLLCPDAFDIDKKKYQTALQEFAECFNELNIVWLNTKTTPNDVLITQIIKRENYNNNGFRGHCQRFNELNQYLTGMSSAQYRYIKEELPNHKLIEDVFAEFQGLIRDYYCIIYNLVNRISPEKNKINRLMFDYVIEHLKRFAYDPRYIMFIQEIASMVFILQSNVLFKRSFMSFSNKDCLIYLSYLIKIMIPDISNINKINTFKSDKLINYFLSVRSIIKPGEEVISHGDKYIESSRTNLYRLCNSYLLLGNEGGLCQLQNNVIEVIRDSIKEDANRHDACISDQRYKINKMVDDKFLPTSEQADLTNEDIKEILEYDSKRPSKNLGEIGRDLVNYGIEIPECFTKLNTKEDLTKGDLKEAWLEYQKQQEDLLNKTT